jgi:hypothetical protein
MPVVISFLCREEYSDTIIRELSEELGLQTVDRYGTFPTENMDGYAFKDQSVACGACAPALFKSGSAS